MNASDILSELSIRVYEPPLSLLRENGKISNLNNPLAVLMLIIDFETELTMNGINDFIGNSTGLYAYETVDALKIIGCDETSKMLSDILKKAKDAGMTHEAIQNDRQRLEAYTVTTFHQLHGDKWDKVIDEIDHLAEQIDLQQVINCAENYIGMYKDVFTDSIKKSEEN